MIECRRDPNGFQKAFIELAFALQTIGRAKRAKRTRPRPQVEVFEDFAVGADPVGVVRMLFDVSSQGADKSDDLRDLSKEELREKLEKYGVGNHPVVDAHFGKRKSPKTKGRSG